MTIDMMLQLIKKRHWKSFILLSILLLLIFMYFTYPVSRKLVPIKRTEEVVFVIKTLNGTNKARMSSAQVPATRDVMKKDDCGLFHIVTTFVPFDNKDIRNNLFIKGKPPTDQQIEARMAEITNCLQRNLNNGMIAFVHVLVFRNATIAYLRSLNLQNSQKLILHKNNESTTMLQKLMYASNYLQGKTVIICHQDNYIGEGWEHVNHNILKWERLMYALTRHPSPTKCKATMEAANCGEDSSYIGSHDAFVFYVNGFLTREKLVDLDVTPNINGMENVLIWVFQTKLNYRILNPCKVLIVYHSHCLSIRDKGRRRINVGGKNAGAKFTDKLQ